MAYLRPYIVKEMSRSLNGKPGTVHKQVVIDATSVKGAITKYKRRRLYPFSVIRAEMEDVTMMRRYEQAIRSNMASAEKDYSGSPEDRRGFVIGAVLKLWETYQSRQIDESQLDKLVGVLSNFSNGEYREFIAGLVKDYKAGNPPTIIGY